MWIESLSLNLTYKSHKLSMCVSLWSPCKINGFLLFTYPPKPHSQQTVFHKLWKAV